MLSETWQSDSNIVRLLVGEMKKAEPMCECFFQADDPDGDEKEFAPIAYTAMELLAQGHVVSYYAHYAKRREARHRLLGGWRPAKFSAADGASMLKQRLLDSGWKDGLMADIVSFTESRILWSKERRYHKRLCILQERLDMKLLRQTDFTYCGFPKHERIIGGGCCGVAMKVFPEQMIWRQETTEATVSHYDSSQEFMVEFLADIILPRAYITLNTKYMSVDQLADKLRQAAALHDKKLEVEK
ncbi:MAG: hypothetical protein Q4B96_07530 [Bacillota bacterium]|nr:hypothetical protein [Bacillota bacterium]